MNTSGLDRKIPAWIKKQVKKAKSKGCILGLSGGIDSAVIAALCLKAVGRKNILALILPCHSVKNDIKDALSVVKKFKLKYKTVDLSPVFDFLAKTLPKGSKLSLANLKPRLRMITLYYFANNLNYLVVGTGNKSELMAGYFTKYGDGGVDLLPIGSLYKKDVLALAKKLKIPGQIISKPPSAGLWQGQTDEGEMGITYNELDSILKTMHKGSFRGKTGKKVKKLFNRSSHKRCLPPIYA
jgi:NAD+ synthase